jgi:hypothetical protein
MARSPAFCAALLVAAAALALAPAPTRAAGVTISAATGEAAATSASAAASAAAARPPLTRLDLQLRAAVEEDDEDEAAALVRRGASSIAPDEKGRTAIAVAAGFGHEGVLAKLLELAGPGAAGAASLPDDGGMRALHIAAARGMEGCVAQLLKLGANASGVFARDKVGWTPLFHAADKASCAAARRSTRCARNARKRRARARAGKRALARARDGELARAHTHSHGTCALASPLHLLRAARCAHHTLPRARARRTWAPSCRCS